MSFKQGLFGCFGNASLSMISCCAAPVSITKNADAVGESHPIAWALAVQTVPCVAGALLRGQIRKKKGIDGDFKTDCLIWMCFSCCAVCQETAEMGSMDYLISPEMQAMERSAQAATQQ